MVTFLNPSHETSPSSPFWDTHSFHANLHGVLATVSFLTFPFLHGTRGWPGRSLAVLPAPTLYHSRNLSFLPDQRCWPFSQCALSQCCSETLPAYEASLGLQLHSSFSTAVQPSLLLSPSLSHLSGSVHRLRFKCSSDNDSGDDF